MMIRTIAPRPRSDSWTSFRLPTFPKFLLIAAAVWLALAAQVTKAADAPPITPTRFDVRANDLSTDGVPVVRPWKTIVLDPAYRGAWMVAGDVDGDGEAEIVSARNFNRNDVHHTVSVVAQRLDGSILWTWGKPQDGDNRLGYDVACQIYDWDGDGQKEVVVATKEAIVEIDGKTGKEKRRFAIPPDSSDCIVFCDLAGDGHASEILVKTRYTQVWAYDYDGNQLWSSKLPGSYRTAHQPRPIDIDGDGKDEVVTGFSMLNADGSLRWALDKADPAFEVGKDIYSGHLDCARLLHRGATPAESSLAITFCTGERLALINGEGRIRWSVAGHHFESADVGKVCPDVPGPQIVVDVDHRQRGENPLWVFDQYGSPLGQIIADGSRHHLLIDWFGEGYESIMMATPRALFDGRGNKVALFETPAPEGQREGRRGWLCAKGDMTGDGVPDLLLSTNPGSAVYIFKNENGEKTSGPTEPGMGVNFTLY